MKSKNKVQFPGRKQRQHKKKHVRPESIFKASAIIPGERETIVAGSQEDVPKMPPPLGMLPPGTWSPVKVVMLAVLVLLGPGLRQVHALRCFSCSVTASSGDKNCISDPSSVEGQSVVNCNRKYCTIQRQELIDPPGKLNTFLRSCEESPLYLNDVIEDPTFRTYYRSCSSDLCNSGDGMETAGGLSGLDAGASENLLVPGLAASSQRRPPPYFTGMSLAMLAAVVSWRTCFGLIFQ